MSTLWLTSARNKIQPLRYETRLSPDKAYLTIGCLGGLGRSLSRWMVDRDTRRFIFISRSGADRTAAQELMNDLIKLGVKVQVVQGDVTDESVVERAVEAARAPIGSVVEPAMNLNLNHTLLITSVTQSPTNPLPQQGIPLCPIYAL